MKLFYNPEVAEDAKTEGPRRSCPWCHRAAIKVAELGDLIDIKGEVRMKGKCPHKECGKAVTFVLGKEERVYIKVIKTLSKAVVVIVITAITGASLLLIKNVNEKFTYLINNYIPHVNE